MIIGYLFVLIVVTELSRAGWVEAGGESDMLWSMNERVRACVLFFL